MFTKWRVSRAVWIYDVRYIQILLLLILLVFLHIEECFFLVDGRRGTECKQHAFFEVVSNIPSSKILIKIRIKSNGNLNSDSEIYLHEVINLILQILNCVNI